jgi:hypothetical protein
MQNAHVAMTPMDPNLKLDLAEDRGEEQLEDIKEYQPIVESLMYAALATRPDISFAVAGLCQYKFSPIHNSSDCCKESSSISQTYSRLSTPRQC